MVGCEDTGEKSTSNIKEVPSSKNVFWRATLWLMVGLGLSFFAAYQLVGTTDVKVYEKQLDGTSLHESPGLLGALSSALGLSSSVRAKRQESDESTNWSDYDPFNFQDFWSNYYDYDEDDEEENSTQWQSIETSSTVYPTTTTTIWEDSTSATKTPIIPSTTVTASARTSSNDVDVTNTVATAPLTERVTTTEKWKTNPATTETNTEISERTTAHKLSTTFPWWFGEDPMTTKSLRESSQVQTQYPTVSTTGREDPCYPDYPVNIVCELTEKQFNLFGSEISLEDIRALMFDSETIEALTSECTNGTWCLGTSRDRAMFEDVDHIFLDLCPLADCLLDIPEMCVDEERCITMSTLILLCEATKTNSTEPVSCLRSIMKMSHVTLANARRVKNGDKNGICRDADQAECQGSCKTLAQQLRCTCTNCLHRYDLFQEYGPWQWYFGMENSMDKCDLNASDCSMFSEIQEPVYQGLLDRVAMLDTPAIAVITVACLVAMTGFAVVVVICVKKIPKYNRKKVQYKEVNYDDDEDDEEDLLAEFNP